MTTCRSDTNNIDPLLALSKNSTCYLSNIFREMSISFSVSIYIYMQILLKFIN